ncbi:MAG: 50S ribosomal protein L25 [Chitinophagales bacterium]|nr:MAG: 50S ribosomal protein L25 [Chitinophagales bacterium]
MKSLTLEGTLREETGTRKARKYRREGFVPCAIYGRGETLHFYAPYNAFQKIIYTPEFFTVTVKIGAKEYNTILREAQFHPVTDRLLHADFLELEQTRKVTTEVPVKLVGQPAGVKAGGKLDQKMRKLKIRALPQHLLEYIEVNVEPLEVGKSIRVQDIKMPNIEILNAGYLPVATVYATRTADKAGAPASATPAAGAANAAAGEKKAEVKTEKK